MFHVTDIFLQTMDFKDRDFLKRQPYTQILVQILPGSVPGSDSKSSGTDHFGAKLAEC